MESNVITEQAAPDSSTIIEPRAHDVSPAQNAHKEPEDQQEAKPEKTGKPESRMDTIKRAMADLEGKNGKTDPKTGAVKADDAKVEAKADDPKAEDANKAQAEKPEARAEQEAQKPLKPSDGRKIIEAPVRFLPRAKELWNNVPHEVRSEWQRAEQERETEITQYREAKAFSDDLADLNRMARDSGTTVKQAMQNYVGMENMLRSDPAQGFRGLLENMKLSPPQAITHILRAYNITPQQLADHIQRDPTAYTALAPQRQPQQQQYQPQQQQADPQVRALQEQVQQMRAESVTNTVITPFAQEYPEYYQHEDAIAKVLQSGIIEQIHGPSLSPRDKLEAALFMVAPHVGRQTQQSQAPVLDDRDDPPAVDLRGKKSVKGAPSPGTDSSTRRRSNMSREEAFNAAWSELGLR